MAERFAVLRVPSSGPQAVVAEPWDFATRAEATARIAQLEAGHLIQHHTHLEVFAYEGETYAALRSAGILY